MSAPGNCIKSSFDEEFGITNCLMHATMLLFGLRFILGKI
jgi:hypothetical protein